MQKSKPQFAICINTDDPDLLTPRMIYEVLPDESAAKSNYLRVIDNEGEDYLYPANYFISVNFPHAIEKTLMRISLFDVIDRIIRDRTKHVPRVLKRNYNR